MENFNLASFSLGCSLVVLVMSIVHLIVDGSSKRNENNDLIDEGLDSRIHALLDAGVEITKPDDDTIALGPLYLWANNYPYSYGWDLGTPAHLYDGEIPDELPLPRRNTRERLKQAVDNIPVTYGKLPKIRLVVVPCGEETNSA